MIIIDKIGWRTDVGSLPKGSLFRHSEDGRVWIRTDADDGEMVGCVRLDDGFYSDFEKDCFVEPIYGELTVWGASKE